MNESQLSHSELIRLVSTRLIVFILVLLVMLLFPAGTFAYWEAWVYLAILFIPTLFVLAYLLKNDPKLLERRMRMQEREEVQKLIIKLWYFCFLITFLIPGFDHRFGWSKVPLVVVILSDVVVLLGYGIVFLVLRENRYASRIIEVASEQQVVTSGPYALVRHPMYFGVMLMYVFSPLALGSYWAMFPAVLIVPILVARICNEESVLVRELKGYSDYIQETSYRLIPGIW